MKKRVLITGENSYIGDSFYNQAKDTFDIEILSVRGEEWKKFNMNSFDVVFHVAGIAHVKPTSEINKLYESVNRDLAIEVAKKAKQDGVNQFIFMSSMSVYGDHYTVSKPQIIDENTKPNPDTKYGETKLEAEKKIIRLNDETYKVLILRPPMIYGEDAKGNYNRLLSKKSLLFIFPKFNNLRSTISIENFVEFIEYSINNELKGIYCPVDREFLNTSELIASERKKDGKRTILTPVFNPILKLAGTKLGFIKKMFGSNYYVANGSISNIEFLNMDEIIS